MEIPFVFGKAVSGEHFTDREKETKTLVSNFTYGVNTIIISPRRYGKTSLVRKAGSIARAAGLKVVYVDIFSVRTPQEFGAVFAEALIRQTSSKMEEMVGLAREILSRFRPKFTFSKEDVGDLSIAFDIEKGEEDLDELLDLPEKIAARKNCRIVVCIDEFQQISEFKDSVSFQKRLRSRWQHHQLASYCLYGSKKHMMNELFVLPSMPFYRFGEVINLQKISEEDWVEFLKERFEKSGRPIAERIAREICRLTEEYSSYVQQLAWLVWSNYDDGRQEEVLRESFSQLVDHSAILFEQQTQDLTSYQINFLRMLLDGKVRKYNSMEAVKTYGLGSMANVGRLKATLVKKELIELDGGELVIRDPILKVWLRRKILV